MGVPSSGQKDLKDIKDLKDGLSSFESLMSFGSFKSPYGRSTVPIGVHGPQRAILQTVFQVPLTVPYFWIAISP